MSLVFAQVMSRRAIWMLGLCAALVTLMLVAGVDAAAAGQKFR
jgi:hypothetical protein